MKNQTFPSAFRLLFLVILAISLSCNEKVPQTTNSFFTIPFAKIIQNQREIKLSEIASDV